MYKTLKTHLNPCFYDDEIENKQYRWKCDEKGCLAKLLSDILVHRKTKFYMSRKLGTRIGLQIWFAANLSKISNKMKTCENIFFHKLSDSSFDIFSLLSIILSHDCLGIVFYKFSMVYFDWYYDILSVVYLDSGITFPWHG